VTQLKNTVAYITTSKHFSPLVRTKAVLSATFLFSLVDQSQDYECLENISRFILTLPQRRP